MRSRDVDILIIPGLGDSGQDHWQSRWQAKLPTARRVEQSSWTQPRKDAWCGTIRAAIAGTTRPCIVIAHSLGVIAFAEAVQEGALPGAPAVAGAFLVAPPSEATILGLDDVDPAFTPLPSAPLPCPAVLVGSRNDAFATIGETEELALDWGARFVDAGDAGHINSASGHGPWPEGLMAFAGFLNKL